jgi:hypothetical protein
VEKDGLKLRYPFDINYFYQKFSYSGIILPILQGGFEIITFNSVELLSVPCFGYYESEMKERIPQTPGPEIISRLQDDSLLIRVSSRRNSPAFQQRGHALINEPKCNIPVSASGRRRAMSRHLRSCLGRGVLGMIFCRLSGKWYNSAIARSVRIGKWGLKVSMISCRKTWVILKYSPARSSGISPTMDLLPLVR